MRMSYLSLTADQCKANTISTLLATIFAHKQLPNTFNLIRTISAAALKRFFFLAKKKVV